MLHGSRGLEGVRFFPVKSVTEGVRFNVISVMMGWVDVKFAEKIIT